MVSTIATYSFTATADRTLVAHFAINTYTITASAGEGGSITPRGTVTVNHGASQSFTITPDEGYEVADVKVDGVSRGAVTTYNFSDVTANHTISATFAADISPLATWYLAEGSTDWGFDCYISIVNPNAEAVNVDADLHDLHRARSTGPTVTMPAMSQATVFPSATLGAADFSTKVDVHRKARPSAWTAPCTGPGPPPPCPRPTAPPGSPPPPPPGTCRKAPPTGDSSASCSSRTPTTTATDATVTWMIEGDDPGTSDVTVAATSRATFNMADYIGATDASIKVDSDVPGHLRAGHVPQRPQGGPRLRRHPHRGRRLLPGRGLHRLRLHHLRPGPEPQRHRHRRRPSPTRPPPGRWQGPTFTMPANSRKTICVNDTTAIPGPDPSFSTHVHGGQPIIAERAMYWNGGDDGAQVCHDSIGLAAPHTTWYLADGQTSEGRETWTLVQNPNDSDVTVEITYMTPDGTGNVVKTETIPPAPARPSTWPTHSGIAGRAAIMVVCHHAGKPGHVRAGHVLEQPRHRHRHHRGLRRLRRGG